MKRFWKTTALGAVAGVAVLAIACGKDSTSSPTPVETPALATTIEHYVGTIGVGGSGFYSFSVPIYGVIQLTLQSVSGVDDPGVMLGLNLGVPSRFDCAASGSPITAAAATDPQITGSYSVGVYCARVYDVGNLTGPATFDVRIAHP